MDPIKRTQDQSRIRSKKRGKIEKAFKQLDITSSSSSESSGSPDGSIKGKSIN